MHCRFEPKGGASLKQQNAKKNGIVKRRKVSNKKKSDSEKALKRALDACFKNGCSIAEVKEIVCESVNILKM